MVPRERVGGRELEEGGDRVQSSGFKIDKYWGCDVPWMLLRE